MIFVTTEHYIMTDYLTKSINNVISTESQFSPEIIEFYDKSAMTFPPFCLSFK